MFYIQTHTFYIQTHVLLADKNMVATGVDVKKKGIVSKNEWYH
jgi:hypothetical protein